MKRTIVIGDVHGCRREFEELIAKLAPTGEDAVWCLGDFMDKGPEPALCVRIARCWGFRSVLGNHDEKVTRYAKHRARQALEPKTKIPMHYSREQVEQFDLLDDEDKAWIAALPLLAEPLPGLLLVHGGLLPGVPARAQGAAVLRTRFLDSQGKPVKTDFNSDEECPPGGHHWAEVYDGPETVVYGHHPHSLSTVKMIGAWNPGQFARPERGTTYGLDTGCVFGGHLSALVFSPSLPGGRFGQTDVVQVKAHQVYREPPWPIAP